MVEGSAGQAQEKVQEGLRRQIDDRSSQAGERVSGTAQDLRSVGDELRKQGKDMPAKVADRAAEQTEKVGTYLKEKEPDQMLHDVEDFGRQRPWAVLAGGLALGIVAARFLKASSRSRYQQRTGATAGAQASQPLPPPQRSAVEPIATPAPPAPATPTPAP